MKANFQFNDVNIRFKDFCDMAQSCNLCSRLCNRQKVMSSSNGNISSKVLFIAEAPGRLGADRTGIPLYGDKTGENFEILLGNIGWKRSDIFITNAVLCNPREENGNNGTPTQEEIENCSAFLEMTIELIQPEVVISLGAVALKALDLVTPHGLNLRDNASEPLPWADRLLVPLYHPGPRALLHRSLTKQRSDFMSLAKIVHPTKGLITKTRRTRSDTQSFKDVNLVPIHHLVCAIMQYLGRTPYFKLTKLLYMTDVLALERLGHTLTGEIYLRQVEGPWPPKLKDALALLSGYEVKYTSKCRIPIVEPGPCPRFVPQIDSSALDILTEVLEKYGHCSNSQIKIAAYRTEPMRYILTEEKKGRDMRKVPVIYKDKTAMQSEE